MTELLPCPFCGGEARTMVMDLSDVESGWQVWGVWCTQDLEAEQRGDYQHGHYIDNFASEAEAIEAWNARPREPIRCKDCKHHQEDKTCSYLFRLTKTHSGYSELRPHYVDDDDFCSKAERSKHD